MSEIAASHLKQARLVAGWGNRDRAVELLEQARVLVGDDVRLREQVLAQLAELYDAVGRHEEAGQCRSQLERRASAPAPVVPPALVPSRPPVPPQRPAAPGDNTPPARFPRAQLYGGIAAGVLFLVVTGFFVRYLLKARGEVTALAPTAQTVTPAPTPPAIAPRDLVKPAVAVVQSPASRAVAAPPVAHPPPVGPTTVPAIARSIPASPDSAPIAYDSAATSALASPLVVAAHATPKPDREDLLKETVGLCVVVARYEGPIGDLNDVRIDVPLGSGTAFCINSSGLMLTNRHVVAVSKDAPADLEKLKLPTMTRRDISYIICFGPNPRDRYPAKLLHKSEQFDLAILRIDRRIEHPLPLSQKEPRQGDDILVCGYPGVVMAALNAASDTPAQWNDLKAKWESTRHVDAFDGFSPDSFSSTLTKGIVSAPNRNVENARYLQMDAGLSPGNSGGPVLNTDNEVVGIATWGLSQAPTDLHASYNFALRIGQLNEEIQPYLKN